MTKRASSTKVRRQCFEYWRHLTDHGWRMRCRCGCDVEFNPATTAWEADHLIVHAHGGSDEPPNVRPLLAACHKKKTAKDVGKIAKAQRQSDSVYGVRRSQGKPIPGSKRSGWKHKMSGEWERRDG